MVAALIGSLSACRSAETRPSEPDAGRFDELGVLPSRVEVVARADELAVQGERAGGEKGVQLTRRAADLRRRLWRLERRDTDALEGVELYRAAGRAAWPGACEASLDALLLEGELLRDPAETYRGVYLLHKTASARRCRERSDSALLSLGGWKPPLNVLAELDRKAVSDAAASAPAAQASARLDSSGSVVVPVLSVQDSRSPARITKVERYGSVDAARVVIFVTHPTLFEVGFLEAEAARGPRLFVDIERASYAGADGFEVGGIVQKVRLGERKGGTRVVLDLASTVYRKVFYLPEPFRLVIDVSKHATPDVKSSHGQPLSIRRVVLDPGHGGHDPGATGPGGLREKDVTLDIAHRAAPLLARELGVVTLLTRDGDDFVALDERAARANAFHADLFVSIHCNASEDGRAGGVMTFVLDESRDAVASRIAARENAASAAAAAELANAMSRVVDVGGRARSLHFADLLQRATMASLSGHYPDVSDQGIRRAGFYVLAGARMPAVLFETSFISNPTSESRLNTGDYRQRMADGIVNAVRAYREGR
ncbi:MAG TPA: N-acetylmuramoyl-L-alanine amidase [Polyangiaceae bacterium]|nr:N-acetylmuramoyl-L-alanine amidase [Polyangiaceae bacterium]